ncbi:uncharacterized protein LOC106639717 [Copidosoma floridanum]|uniref:uncharacterized protein LOC106639717 n=1 Tax=Copidosoma floridanum TaxID=29053 RepID=UPI0006C99C3E|nr:uncharacterized protein LOC106639717 [Copidosoma floridanum]
MSEMTKVVNNQQHQLGVNIDENLLWCSNCNIHLDSSNSFDVHIRFHHPNLMNEWGGQTRKNNNDENIHDDSSECDNKHGQQQVSNSGKHILSNETASSGICKAGFRLNSGDIRPEMLQQQQLQDHNYDQPFTLANFSDTQYFMSREFALPSPSLDSEQQQIDEQKLSPHITTERSFYSYKLPTHQSDITTETNSSGIVQRNKCSSIFEDVTQLTEHFERSHELLPGTQCILQSPTTSLVQQQLNQAQAQQPQHQIHALRSQTRLDQQQGMSGQSYDFDAIIACKNEKEPEEHAEILDLDSHKVQTHRYEDEYSRIHPHRSHEMDMYTHAHMVHQQNRSDQNHHQQMPILFSGQSMNWTTVLPQDYHSPMLIDNPPSRQEQQKQFVHGQPLIPPVDQRPLNSSPLVTSTEQMLIHPVSGRIIPQSNKPPLGGNQSWKSNEARRPKTYNCTACNKWFTSSGHLKRHYNTTLHKNAVKQSNMPDPATQPISSHHHPNRGDSSLIRKTISNRISPDQLTSNSPPNLMAGPSEKAPRGLLHTPIISMNTPSGRSSNIACVSSELTTNHVTQPQKILQPSLQLQQKIQKQPIQSLEPTLPLTLTLSSTISTTDQIQQNQHMYPKIQQPMASTLLQLSPQPHQPMVSHSPIKTLDYQPMTMIRSPTHQQVHTDSPLQMTITHQQQSESLLSPTVTRVIPDVMTLSSPEAMMKDTLTPHQIYPNVLPPHVTTAVKIPELLVCTISQLTTTGKFNRQYMSSSKRKNQIKMLPGFSTINQQASAFRTYDTNDTSLGKFAIHQSFIQGFNLGKTSQKKNTQILSKSIQSSTFTSESISPNVLSSCQHVSQQQQQQHQQRHTNERNQTKNNKIWEAKDVDINIISKKKNYVKKKKKNPNNKINLTLSKISTDNYVTESVKLRCEPCSKTFYKSCYLTQHNKSFHAGVRPFKCDKCGKRFLEKEKHEVHERVHLNDKPHKCEVCPKSFNHKTDLRRHMCMHTGITPYKCNLCAKKFTRKDHMEKHVAGHNKKSTTRMKIKNNSYNVKFNKNNNNKFLNNNSEYRQTNKYNKKKSMKNTKNDVNSTNNYDSFHNINHDDNNNNNNIFIKMTSSNNFIGLNNDENIYELTSGNINHKS